MPVYNPPIEFLKIALQTIEDQVYPNWELCIADDCSPKAEVRVFLQDYAKGNNKTKITFRQKNGHISAATNSAAELATGDFLVFMDQDDELTPDALAEIALYLDKHPDSDVIYSDDDKNDTMGNRFAPQFKPDWSPELLLSYMYMSHIFSVRKELYWEVGGTRLGYEGSQDYDLALRVTEKARHVGHIPRILYHWRVLEGSTASSGNEKNYSFEAGIKAVQDALDRRSIPAKAYHPKWAIESGCGYYSHKFEDKGDSVAIIIPMKNQAPITSRLLKSLEKTTYKNYKVYIINNESNEEDAVQLLRETKHTVIDIPNKNGNFSYSYINNEAVSKVKEDLILFLNNDIEVISANWLSQMVGYLQISGVEAVGSRLLYPDKTIQHAGVIHGLHHGLPGHSLKLLPYYDAGYMGFAKVLKNYSCVTAACLLMRRKEFNTIGKFDEDSFAVAYNDADLCYRLIESGKRIVYAPTAELYHHEGKSRGYKDNPKEEVAFIEKYKDFKENYYNPNLLKTHDTYKARGRTYLDHDVKITGTRTAFFTHNLNLEGAPIQLLEIATGIKDRDGIIPIVFSPQDGPLRRRAEDLGLEVVIIPSNVIAGIQSEYDETIERITAWLRTHRVEMIFANTILSFWAVDLARKLIIPSIWIIHESEPPFSQINDWSNNAQHTAKKCLGYAYQVIFVSEATKALFEPHAVERNFFVIYNGFDDALMQQKMLFTREHARAKLSLQDKDVFVIMIGTVCERKGQLDFIESVGALDADTIEQARFSIIGDRQSEYSTTMHETLKNLPDSHKRRISIHPETRDVGLYYAAADIFVCCSKIESFPRVIQEAMHCSLAIITTPVFGIAEQVTNDVSAKFFTPGENSKLTRSLASLITNKEERKKLGANSKLRLRRLPDYSKMILEYRQLIAECCIGRDKQTVKTG
jgi:GT2 family glycosyltransferase